MSDIRIYIEPQSKLKSGITMVIAILVITYLIMQYLHIYIKWSDKSIKCKTDNMFIAYLTGNMKQWIKKCVK